jgi:hypothetical protein
MTNENELTDNWQHTFVLNSARATASSEIGRERKDWVYVSQNSQWPVVVKKKITFRINELRYFFDMSP